MELRDYLELGRKKAGTLTALGNLLGLTQPQISTIKAHRKPLPDTALVRLAEFIDVPERELIAANNIAMGKHVDFWRPFVEHARAASLAMALAVVTIFVTPISAEARQMENSGIRTLYYVKFRRIAAWLKKAQLTRTIYRFLKRLQEAPVTICTPRVAEV